MTLFAPVRTKLAILTAGVLILITALVVFFGEFDADGTKSAAETVPEKECDKYASNDEGSNANPGTYVRPFASPQKLSDSLEPGQTGCFFGGTYFEPDRHWQITNGGTSGEPVILKAVTGEKVTYAGWLVVDDAANYLTVKDMIIDGSSAPKNDEGWAGATPTIRGDHVSFLNNEVTNHQGVCFLLGQEDGVAFDTLIQGNKIHHCGQLPATNLHHAIYASNSQSARILDNWIYENVDRGVQLYPDADKTLIEGNVIVGNGQGVIFSGAGRQVSDGNELRNNYIANSRISWNVTANYNQTPLVGRGNTAHNNCLWATNRDDQYNRNGGLDSGVPGFVAHKNSIVSLDFANPKAVTLRQPGSSPHIEPHAGCESVESPGGH